MTVYGHLVSEATLAAIDPELGNRYTLDFSDIAQMSYPEGVVPAGLVVVVLPAINETFQSMQIMELSDSYTESDIVLAVDPINQQIVVTAEDS